MDNIGNYLPRGDPGQTGFLAAGGAIQICFGKNVLAIGAGFRIHNSSRSFRYQRKEIKGSPDSEPTSEVFLTLLSNCSDWKNCTLEIMLLPHISSDPFLIRPADTKKPESSAIRAFWDIHFHLYLSNFELSIPFMSNHKHRDSSPRKIGIAR